MNADKIEQWFGIAERVVARSKIEKTRFSESHPDYFPDYFPRDVVAVLTEGWLRGRRFASWLPVAGQMYRDESYRQMLVARSEDTWRLLARSALVPLEYLHGPKGKLPA